MSDYFEDKDYGDYFKELENTSSEVSRTPQKQTSGGIYRVVRLRRRVLVYGIGVVLCSALALGIAHRAQPKKEEPESGSSQDVSKSVTQEPKVSLFPSDASAAAITDESESKYIAVVDLESGAVIAQRDPDSKAYPASTTKVMTLLTAVENAASLQDTFVMTSEIIDPLYRQDASLAGFLPGETVTILDLLYGAILPSGADATAALALRIAGGEEEFVELMNRKVRELGLKNTHFTNTSGLYDPDHYTTARDMAVILAQAMQNELCRKVLSTYQYTTASTEQHPEGILLTSTLFKFMYGTEPETAVITGGKTGYVNESGYCIASFGKNNTTGKEYVVVTLGGKSLWPAVFGQIELYKTYAK